MRTSKITTTSNAFTSPFKISKSSCRLRPGRWLLLYDKKLGAKVSRIHGARAKLAVVGGEKIKNLREAEKILTQISKLEEKHGCFDGFCVAGGGSVGDLGAFLASIYRRGVRLVHVPTTYLAVIDSAFGGKTALNFGQAKNQVGSFYPAELVFLVQDLLPRDDKLLKDAAAEILKMAILEGSLWRRLIYVRKLDGKTFWRLAPAVIRAKLRVVAQDPRETRGRRRVLNLGHTLGHVFEKLGHLSHGEAVALGLCYELEYFLLRGQISISAYEEIAQLWEQLFDFKKLSRKLGRHSVASARSLLLKDKKAEGATIQSPVVHSIGAVTVKPLPVQDLLTFLKFQGVLR